ncbi:MAG: glycosyltransferase family 2 protein, partial [Candidatus Moranbacteria bacterium]|nr:glycosyltransferase family 2 protein [Candidatus Moranbacteria bacterium]
MTIPCSDNFAALAKEAYRRPLDVEVVDSYFKKYETMDLHDIWDDIKYKQLKLLRNPQEIILLNQLAGLFLEINKPFIARMCLLESLRLNPDQEDVFNDIEQLNAFSSPPAFTSSGTEQNKISILMTTYNRGSLIKESIESILNQSYQNFELLIGNDGGSSEVGNIIASFNSPKIRYFHFPENRGKSAVLNDLVRESVGLYIAYLDDDDIYYSECFARLKNELDNCELPLVYGKTIVKKGFLIDNQFQMEKVLRFYGEPFNRELFLN